MKNKIYTYFFKEFIRFFFIILFALTAIVWTVQAVNYLELITEDGHAFSIYFLYSILGIPKIITKLLPFTFLTSIILTILKFEKSNELIILWTSGLNKIKIVNTALIIAFLATAVQIILYSTVSPTTLNISRSMINTSDLNLFPSMLQERKFNDAINKLTMFVDKKNPDGTLENVFLRDDNTPNQSSTIIAKSGAISSSNKNILILFDGIIQNQDKDKISIIKFNKSEFDLSSYSSSGFSGVKIQETSTIKLLNCLNPGKKNNPLFNLNFLFYKKKGAAENLSLIDKNCNFERSETISELNRRLGMALYIPLLSLIACFLLSSRRENKNSDYFKYICFFVGFIILIFAEVSLRYSGKISQISILYYLVPIILLILTYLILIRIFKYENL